MNSKSYPDWFFDCVHFYRCQDQKVGGSVVYHARKRYVHDASALLLAFESIQRIFTMSSHLIGTNFETERILYMLDFIEYALL